VNGMIIKYQTIHKFLQGKIKERMVYRFYTFKKVIIVNYWRELVNYSHRVLWIIARNNLL